MRLPVALLDFPLEFCFALYEEESFFSFCYFIPFLIAFKRNHRMKKKYFL